MYEAGKLNRKGSPLRVTEYVETPSSSGNLNHKWLEARYLEKVIMHASLVLTLPQIPSSDCCGRQAI